MQVRERNSGPWVSGLTDIERETLYTLVWDTLTWCVHDRAEPFDMRRYDLTSALQTPRATFVTLHAGGHLRGCIGSLAPEAALYRSAHENAVNAARHDPRFPPVTPRELAGLHVDVSILSPIEPLADWRKFRIGEQGIILSKGRYRAVYLPEVAAEQGWTIEETLASLCAKAGLPPDAWRLGAQLSVFYSAVLAAERN